MRAKLIATVPGSPPAVWSAFAKQAAWKDWIIVGLLVLNALTIVAGARLARQQPDVVLVAPDGKSTYLPHAIEGDALAGFLAEQKQLPSDVTIVHFTREFLQLALAINSSTIEGAWADALAMMTPELREHVAADAVSKKLIDSYRAAKVRTALIIDGVELIAKTESLLQVRARVTRKIGTLLVAADGASATDQLEVDLVERIVPRTNARPDGLEIVELRIKKEAASAAEGKSNAP